MSTHAPVVDEAEYRRLLADPDMQRCLNPKCLDDVLCCYGDCPPPQTTQLERDRMSTIDILTTEGRAHVDRIAGKTFADDGDRVDWLAARATQLAKLEPELKQVHADLRELAAAHAAEQSKGGTRISGEVHGQILKSLGRTEPFKNGAELMEALAAQDRELEQSKARLHAAEMQATGRRLAAERREREAEEETYPDDFARRFGEPALLEVAEQQRHLERSDLSARRRPPANEDEEYRRDFERRHGMKART